MYEEGAREIALSVVNGINCKYDDAFMVIACFFFFFFHGYMVTPIYELSRQLYHFPASIFAYGQTSSGKTYTMNGITEYTAAEIFDYVHKVRSHSLTLDLNFYINHVSVIGVSTFLLINCVAIIIIEMLQHEERAFVVKFSAIEIYNEVVRDLLGTDNTPLRLLDDPDVGGLSVHTCILF